MMMKMYFFFGHLDHLLFSTWSLNTTGKLFGAVIVVIILAILYELLKTSRELLLAHEEKRKRRNVEDVEGQNEETPLLTINSNSVSSSVVIKYTKTVLKQYISPLHIIQSLLQVVQVGLGYILMLVAMTFNGYLFLAVCIGAGIGYYLFAGFRRSVFSFGEQSEHCH